MGEGEENSYSLYLLFIFQKGGKSMTLLSGGHWASSKKKTGAFKNRYYTTTTTEVCDLELFYIGEEKIF